MTFRRNVLVFDTKSLDFLMCHVETTNQRSASFRMCGVNCQQLHRDSLLQLYRDDAPDLASGRHRVRNKLCPERSVNESTTDDKDVTTVVNKTDSQSGEKDEQLVAVTKYEEAVKMLEMLRNG